MKQLFNFLIALLIIPAVAIAQPGGRSGPGIKRIHAAKMAYITDRVHLTSEQSANFIPLYNEYEQDLRAIRQSFFKKYKGADAGGKEPDKMAARQFVEDDLDYQQQVIGLKRKYNDSFLKVISPQQLADLYTAEREFRQMLMQQLKQRRGEGRWR